MNRLTIPARSDLEPFIKDARTLQTFEELFEAVAAMIPATRCLFQNATNSTAITATGVQSFDVSYTIEDSGILNNLGCRIRIHAAGVLTAGANAGTITLGVKIGGVQITTAYTTSYTVSAGNGWAMDWILVVRTTGAAGKFIVQVNEFIDYGLTATREGNNFFTTATQLPAGGVDITGSPKIEITTNVNAGLNSNVLTDLAIFIENPGG